VKRAAGVLAVAGLTAALLPLGARADVVRQSASGVVVTRTPGGEVTGVGYRRQLVDVSNCYLLRETVGGNAFWGLQTDLSTGVQGYVNDYYLGGRCAR